MFYEHRDKGNRFSHRDRINQTFEILFEKTVLEQEAADDKKMSDEEKKRFREIAWEEFQRTIKEK